MDFSDPKRVYGWIAVSLSLTYKFPQIYKIWNSGGDIRGISVLSQVSTRTVSDKRQAVDETMMPMLLCARNKCVCFCV